MMDGLSIHQFFFWVKKVTSLHYTLPSSSLPPSSLLVAKVKMKQIWEVPSRFLAFKGLVLQWFFTLKFCQTKLTISKWIPSSNSCGCILLTFGSHSGTTSNIVEYWSGTSKICTALTIQKVSRHSSSVFQQQQLFLKVFIEFPWTLGVVGLPNWDGELWGAKGSTMTLQPLGISQPKVSMWSPKKNGGRGRGRVDVGGSNRSGFLWEFNPFLVFFHWKKWGGVDWLVKITNQVLSFQKKNVCSETVPPCCNLWGKCASLLLHSSIVVIWEGKEPSWPYRTPRRRKAIFPTSRLLMACSIQTFPTLNTSKTEKDTNMDLNPKKTPK